jgi:hypothetical protein
MPADAAAGTDEVGLEAWEFPTPGFGPPSITLPLDYGLHADERLCTRCEHPDDYPTFLSVVLDGMPLYISRFFRSVTTFPEQNVKKIGDGRLMDSEDYLQPLCTKCSGPLIAALEQVPAHAEGVHSCYCAVPRCCRRCEPLFDGVTADLLEERQFFIPDEAFYTWKSMGQLKFGHDKKNFHVGWTAACESSMRKPLDDFHLRRCEALMDFLPAITRLQSVPAYTLPRLVSLMNFRCLNSLFCKPLYSKKQRWQLYPQHLGFSNQVYRHNFATAWTPVGDVRAAASASVSEASDALSQLEVEVDSRDGVVPARVQRVTPERAAEVGITGQDLPERLPSEGPPQMSADGRHELTDTEVAFRTGPIVGNPVVFDPTSEHNVAAVATERIGGKHAESRAYLWDPDPEMKKHAKAIVNVLKSRLFTQANVRKWTLELGTADQLFDPKLSEQAARNLITEIQAGYQLKTQMPFMVKRECTAKSSKPPRGIADAGLATFVASAQVLKVIEHGLSELDHAVNIKHRPKDEVLDAISEECTEEFVYQSHGGLDRKRFPPESFRFLESDYSRFEFSQALEFESDAAGRVVGWQVPPLSEYEMGMLAWERELIRHVSTLLPQVLHELREQSEQVNLPSTVRTSFVPKLKIDQSSFRRPSWSLTLHLLCRTSGQGQTSWGNRLNNAISMTIATLKSPVSFWARLCDFHEGTRPASDALKPETWVFISQWGEMIRWRPWMEGDDFKAHVGGSRELAANPLECRLDALPNWQGVLDRLHKLGLEPKMVLYRSAE